MLDAILMQIIWMAIGVGVYYLLVLPIRGIRWAWNKITNRRVYVLYK